MIYKAKTEDGHTYECEGKYITQAVANLAKRHPELVGQWVKIAGVFEKVDPHANDALD